MFEDKADISNSVEFKIAPNIKVSNVFSCTASVIVKGTYCKVSSSEGSFIGSSAVLRSRFRFTGHQLLVPHQGPLLHHSV